MSSIRTVFEISRWEFRRWFKLKGTIIAFVFFAVMGLGYNAMSYFLDQRDIAAVKLAVIGGEMLSQSLTDSSRFRFTEFPDPISEAALRDSVGTGAYDGLLIMRSVDRAELVVIKGPRWESELNQILTAERRRLKLESLSVSNEQLIDALTPFSISVTYHELGRGPSTLAEKVTAGLLVLLMLIGIFSSLGCQMVAITGEKQLRVTEQIISAVTPQQWIDGKILGVSGYAAVSTLVVVLGSLPMIFVSHVSGQALPIPIEVANPLNILIVFVVTVGGFLFWNTFLAALAATINDPNTSSRTGTLFLPLAPLVFAALIAVKSPASVLSKVLSLLPITSPAVIPVRIAMGEIAAWEIVVGVVLLFVATWYMRILAGKIFRVGMLMYGKEPTLAEMIRWIKEA